MEIAMKSLLLTTVLVLCSLTINAAEKAPYKVGVSTLKVESKTRPLTGHIWYPTIDKQEERIIGGNPVWHGFKAINDASIAKGEFPLVIISHGSFGLSENQSWLATVLAKKGYIVASPNHPGTTHFQREPEARRQLWERPKDTSRTISMLLADSTFSKAINKNKIIVIGHSLGGFDAMLLIGAKFNKAHLDNFSKTHPKSTASSLFKKWKIASDAESQKMMESSLSDDRISAVVLFDLGGTQSFTKDNLATIKRPILVIGAGKNSNGMNIEEESRALVAALPSKNTQYFEPEDLTHFDFLGQCKLGAEAILKKEDPDDLIVCKNGGEERAEKHKMIIEYVLNFLLSNEL